MRKLAMLCAALVLSGCMGDLFDIPAPQCAQPAPKFAGTWKGTLGAHELTLRMRELCGTTFVVEGFSWMVEGDWTWGGETGYVMASPYFSGGDVQISLGFREPGQFPNYVIVSVPRQLPAGATMTGIAHGRWLQRTDSTQTFAAFDSVSITLRRQ